MEPDRLVADAADYADLAALLHQYRSDPTAWVRAIDQRFPGRREWALEVGGMCRSSDGDCNRCNSPAGVL